MQITISGHGLEITQAIRDYAQEKLEKLKKRGQGITRINVIFNVEKLLQVAKATLHLPGTEIHARSESSDLYSAIDDLSEKLEHQITKHKEKSHDHHIKDRMLEE